jgi:hypothetical protein
VFLFAICKLPDQCFDCMEAAFKIRDGCISLSQPSLERGT